MVTGCMLVMLNVQVVADGGPVELPRFPSISPDGREIVFSSAGDLWRVPAGGGSAVRLTRHELDDLHSTWSPDGRSIVFTSMRDGHMNLWRIQRDGTGLAQLTFSDRFMRHPNFALDERGAPVVTFSGLIEADVYRDQRPYRLSPEGGQHRRLHDAFGSEPKLAQDGRRMVFTRGGHYHNWGRRHYRGPDAMNIWLYDPRGNRFEAITEREGDDGSAQWAGKNSLIFMSDRELDTVNLYRVDLDAKPRTFERLTDFGQRDVQHFDVSRDGKRAVIQVWDTLYTLDLEDSGAMPEPLLLRAGEPGRDAYELKRIGRDVTEAALSPDGQTMAYVAYGRVYVRHMDADSPTMLVTPNSHARHQGVAWSPDGLRLYFTNDAQGSASIFEARVALTRKEIRDAFIEPRTRELLTDPTPVGQEHDSTDPNGADVPAADTDAVHWDDDPFAPVEPLDPVVEPDPAAEPLEPEPEPEPAAPAEPAPAPPPPAPPQEVEPPEAQAGAPSNLDPSRWHDAVQFYVLPLVASRYEDQDVSPSPDGRSIAFRRGRGDLMVKDLVSGEIRTLMEHWDSSLSWRWSPDSRLLAYSQNDLNFSTNIFIVPADGSEKPVNITRHPRNDTNPRWSADGRILSFISNRSGDSYDLYRVYLDRRFENYSPRELAAYYRSARTEAAKRRPLPVTDPARSNGSIPATPAAEPLDLDNAWRRIERVTNSPTNQWANEMTPGGDRYVFNSTGTGLMVANWDGEGRRRIGPTARIQHLSLNGERVVHIIQGRVGVTNLADGNTSNPDIDDRIRIDLRAQSLQKFGEMTRMIGANFYHADMKGLDWDTLVADYETLVKRAVTSSEFSDITNRLMGELAASHVGVSNPGPASALREPSGRLGIEYDPVILDNGSTGFRIRTVTPDGPADRGPMRLKAGDIITQVDLQRFEGQDTLLKRLRGRIDQEVIVTVERPIARRRVQILQALITPVSYADFARLRYDAFRETSRQRVDELSNGRLGYVHIQSMDQASLDEFQGNLYAAADGKDGLVIDVRNNSGGHTTDRILTSIMAREHAYTVPAGANPLNGPGHYPQDRLDAPRYTLPINMLANEKSYSNSEILAHAFRTLERGTLVGQQTYGGVISTGSHTLIDGATVRRPSRGWYLPDGTDMEHNGARPDIVVPQTPEDEIANRDRQLEVAVDDLLRRLDGARPGDSVSQTGQR